MEDLRSKRYDVYALAFFLVLTFILSLKQVVPFNSVDEAEIFGWLKQVDQEGFPAINYPPLFIYFHYVLSWIYGHVFSFLGIIPSASDFLYTETGFRFTIEAGRVINACLGTVTVYWVYKTGREFYGRHAGLAAALVMACNPLLVLYSHIFKPEIAVTLLMTVTLYYLLKYLHSEAGEKRRRYLLYASILFGLALACKTNAFPILAVFFLVLLLPRRITRVPADAGEPAKQGKFKKFLGKKWAVVPTGIAAGFLAGAPNWLINPLGNIKLLTAQNSPAVGMLAGQLEPRSITETYGALGLDLIQHLGPVAVGLFVIAVIAGFVNRVQKDLLLSVYILSYVALLAFFGDYAVRFALPLIPAAALLIAKLLFVDLETLSHFKGRWNFRPMWKHAVPVLWVLFAAYGLLNLVGNIKTFNLLNTQSQRNRITEYRQQHNLDKKRFNIGHQVLTPRIKRMHVKINNRFQLKHRRRHKNRTLHFIQAHLQTYLNFTNLEKKIPGALNLSGHKPFHTIKKRKYQPWNRDCVFLYKISPKLINVKPGNKTVRFPRPYYEAEDTSFLPLQPYEKNPNFGIMKNGSFYRTIYSTREIKRLTLWLFSYQPDADVILRVNNLEKVIKFENRPPMQQLVIKNPRAKSLHYDYVYEIELSSPQRNLAKKPYYIAWHPEYDVFSKGSGKPGEPGKQAAAKFRLPGKGNPPGVFTKKRFPLWALLVYKETGIDLSLLSYLSTHYMYYDTTKKLHKHLELDFTPVERGSYYVGVNAEPASPYHPLGTGVIIECTYYTLTGGRRERIAMKGKPGKLFALNIREPIAFVKIKIKNLRENNYLVSKVSLTPNYLWHFNKHLVKKRKKPKPHARKKRKPNVNKQRKNR